MKFIDIPNEDQKALLDSLQTQIGLKSAVIEKDWWVTTVLRSLFKLPYADHLSFKGGTSLSKCWHLIERMSEDIDIGITREYLGYAGDLSKNQISDKLRRAACTFVREKLQFDLQRQMVTEGVNPEKFSIKVDITSVSTTDPEVILVEYESLTSHIPYIPTTVKIEVSGRSMSEPVAETDVNSMIDEHISNAPFKEEKFAVRAVLPQRTFLEKVFLLHEEFSKLDDQIRVNRMSRHLYDLYKMLKASIFEKALSDKDLFSQVAEHRRKFIGLKGFDYDTLRRGKINIIPPESVYSEWKEDYERMQAEMIYGESISFDEMISRLKHLNKIINSEE